jgi:hypothetical protein
MVERFEREIKEILAEALDTDIHHDLSEYHKGQWCPIQETFCQEGYCLECEIFRQKTAKSANSAD